MQKDKSNSTEIIQVGLHSSAKLLCYTPPQSYYNNFAEELTLHSPPAGQLQTRLGLPSARYRYSSGSADINTIVLSYDAVSDKTGGSTSCDRLIKLLHFLIHKNHLLYFFSLNWNVFQTNKVYSVPQPRMSSVT